MPRSLSKKVDDESLLNKLPREDNPYQVELLGEMQADTIFIHNTSGTLYHIEPTSKTNDNDDAVPFEVNQVRAFSKDEVNNNRFKKALMSGKLRIVSEAEANKIELDAKKNLRTGEGKKKAGVASSGLSNNTKQALMYIYECDDIDELEAYADLDEREVITAAIEERIEQLEDGNFGK
jgi:hypothetical protein